jgi:copper chaperone CopZ
MKLLLFLLLFPTLLFLQTGQARTVEIDVYGMTCAFCVDSLERKFVKMESVTKVEVSLKLKKVRLETDKNAPGIDAIKQAVLDAGFTPIKITILPNETK